MPPLRFSHGFENDVFVSYTHVDDKPDATGLRWVSQFEIDLRTRVEQVAGRTIQLWRDTKLGGADRFDQEIADQVARSAVLLAVLTPSYFGSTYCAREREEFRRSVASRTLSTGNKEPFVKVAKTHVDLTEYPQDLKRLLEYRFYVEEPDGMYREFHLHEEDAVRRRYVTRVDDVAQEVSKILKVLEGGAPTSTKGTITWRKPLPTLKSSATPSVAAFSSGVMRSCPRLHCACYQPWKSRRRCAATSNSA